MGTRRTQLLLRIAAASRLEIQRRPGCAAPELDRRTRTARARPVVAAPVDREPPQRRRTEQRPTGSPPDDASTRRTGDHRLEVRSGSGKNITPKREKTTSNDPGPRDVLDASPSMTDTVGRLAQRSLARASMGADGSIPTTRPCAPARSASASSVSPQPQPTSSTASRGVIAAESSAASPKGRSIRSSLVCSCTQRPAVGPFQ